MALSRGREVVLNNQQPGGPQLSPDGKWWWDGHAWQPVQAPASPPGPPGGPRRRRVPLLVWVGLGALILLMGVCTVAVATSPSFQQGAKAGAKAALSTSTPTATPTPSRTSSPTKAVTPSSQTGTAAPLRSAGACAPSGQDLLVRYVVLGLPASAQLLGDVEIVNCQSTIAFLQKTSPTGPGYGTEVAYAKDNPGYNTSAEPAPRLQHVIAAFGPAC